MKDKQKLEDQKDLPNQDNTKELPKDKPCGLCGHVGGNGKIKSQFGPDRDFYCPQCKIQ